jgi:hypothetical protein
MGNEHYDGMATAPNNYLSVCTMQRQFSDQEAQSKDEVTVNILLILHANMYDFSA